MGRSRNLHQHEIFYFKERALAALSRAEPIVADPHQHDEAMLFLLPLLHQVTELEVKFAYLLQEEATELTADSPECLELERLKKELVEWSEVYIASEMWSKIQDAMRQKRRRSTPVWLKTLRKILDPSLSDDAPRWINPTKHRDPFAARLLVPRRSESLEKKPTFDQAQPLANRHH